MHFAVAPPIPRAPPDISADLPSSLFMALSSEDYEVSKVMLRPSLAVEKPRWHFISVLLAELVIKPHPLAGERKETGGD
jgi:hypothetical protein